MPDTARSRAQTYSLLTAAALALQAAGGLFISGLYRDNAWVSSILRGQDFVALALVTPLLLVSHTRAQRGSLRWRLVWLGALYKIFYNNMYYLAGSAFNRYFLVYVAVFIFSSFAIVAALLDTDPTRDVAGILPARRKLAAAILFVEAGILTVLWVAQSIAYIVTGKLPKLVEDAGGSVHLIASFDLTLVVPVLVLGAVWLWQSRPWGYVVAAAMSVQCGLITVDLLVTPAFQAAAGVPDAWAMVPLFAAMAMGFFASVFLLLRSAAGVPHRVYSSEGT